LLSQTRGYRDCLGRFPTGVALISLSDQGCARAMTVNSFVSVSLEPRLILWSLDNNCSHYSLFLSASHFAVNVLAYDQQGLSIACARNNNLEVSGAHWRIAANGAPLVDGAVAHFECTMRQTIPAGDHQIILGEVTGFDMPRDEASLAFVRSQYAGL